MILLLLAIGNLNAVNGSLQLETDCAEDAFDEMDMWMDYGFSERTASCFGNAAYALCMGYSWGDIQAGGGNCF